MAAPWLARPTPDVRNSSIRTLGRREAGCTLESIPVTCFGLSGGLTQRELASGRKDDIEVTSDGAIESE